MEPREVIDRMLQVIVLADKLPTNPSWPQLKGELSPSGAFTCEQLDQMKEYIVKKFYDIRMEQMRLGMDQLLIDSLKDHTSECSNKDSGFNESRRGSNFDEESFQPTLNAAATADYSCFMSVCVNGKWEGAALKYCLEEESFISLRWARRYNLEMDEGQIRLTWKFNELDRTYATQFILLDHLEPDFMLGVKSSDEVFNRDDGAGADRNGKARQSPIDPSPTQFAGMVPSTQAWVNQQSPNTEFLGDLIYYLERKYHYPTLLEAPHHFMPLNQGAVLGEGSISSFSSISHNPPNKKIPTSRRSRSKSRHSHSKSSHHHSA